MFAPISSTGIMTLGTQGTEILGSETSSDLILQADELSRPMFVNVSGSSSALVEVRDDLAYQGAVYNVSINETVTIWYKVVNGNNNTLPILHGYNSQCLFQ